MSEILLQPFPDGRPPYIEADGPLDTQCWLWIGFTHRKGYACRWVDGRRVTVHRELVGTLGPDEDAHHRCEARRCVNPDHVERLTKAEHARLHRGGQTALEATLDLLARKPGLTPVTIARQTGHSHSAVTQALYRAFRSGRVRRVNRGGYENAEAVSLEDAPATRGSVV